MQKWLFELIKILGLKILSLMNNYYHRWVKSEAGHFDPKMAVFFYTAVIFLSIYVASQGKKAILTDLSVLRKLQK